VTEQSNTWPACIGEHAEELAKPRDWAAACAATQVRFGADIGLAGRVILDSIHAERGRVGAECSLEDNPKDEVKTSQRAV